MKRIRLKKGKYALVDDEDYEKLKDHKWYLSKKNENLLYATTKILINYTIFHGVKYGGKSISTSMHRVILNPPKDKVVDHINGNGLDNRKVNIRICTQAENIANSRLSRRNTSGYKGVAYYKKLGKWAARIGDFRKKNGRYHIGMFDDPKKAALAYNVEAKKRYGEFAFQNDIMIYCSQ